MRALDPSSSTEYQKVLYQLQRMMGLSKTIPSLRVWDISAPGLTSRFQERVSQSLEKGAKLGPEVLECYHSITDSSALNDHGEMCELVKKVQEKGLHFPEDGSGVTFVHGDLPPEDLKPDAESAAGTRALVLCSVLVGRSFPAKSDNPDSIDNNSSSDSAESGSLVQANVEGEECSLNEGAENVECLPSKKDFSAELPVGFDSFCTPNTLHDKSKSETSSALLPYRAEFKVYESAGVNPRFLVTFRRQDVSGADKELLCDNCCAVAADVYCRHEDANLCKECDRELHNNKFLAKHKRVPLRCTNTQDDPTAASMGEVESDSSLEIFKSKCPFHSNMDVEFFCPDCDVPVCIYCKMVGSHSQGDANNHRLIGVRVAWKRAIDEASMRDTNITTIHRDLRKEAGNLRRLGQNVDLNEASMIKRIDEMAEKARARVRAHALAKRKVLASDAFRVQRRSQELENVSSFLELQKRKLLPVEFITFWGVHKRIVAELVSRPVETPKSLNEVVPDIEVTSSQINMKTTAPYHPYPYQVDGPQTDQSAKTSKSIQSNRRPSDKRRAGEFYSAMNQSHSGESDSEGDTYSDSDGFSEDEDQENSADNIKRRNRRRLSMISAKMRRKRRSTIVDVADLMEL